MDRLSFRFRFRFHPCPLLDESHGFHVLHIFLIRLPVRHPRPLWDAQGPSPRAGHDGAGRSAHLQVDGRRALRQHRSRRAKIRLCHDLPASLSCSTATCQTLLPVPMLPRLAKSPRAPLADAGPLLEGALGWHEQLQQHPPGDRLYEHKLAVCALTGSPGRPCRWGSHAPASTDKRAAFSSSSTPRRPAHSPMTHRILDGSPRSYL